MDTKTEHNIEKIFCYNCKIPEETATVNNRRESKLIIVKQHFGPLNFKNLLFYQIICLECKRLSLVSMEEKNPKYFKFIEIRKVEDDDIFKAKMQARAVGENSVLEKLDSFELS